MNDIKKYPSENECHELIRTYRMLPNIIDHSVQVMRVSVAIYENLKHPELLSKELIVAAALLHDIEKQGPLKEKNCATISSVAR